ncbi:MAG TPA: flagellar basal body P-ring formation chaperone FlgA [Azospirillaceae bacterium]|nr:flagellar basal body P-ring formation chaperone FlgA [Azospirillaceae bacterium]
MKRIAVTLLAAALLAGTAAPALAQVIPAATQATAQATAQTTIVRADIEKALTEALAAAGAPAGTQVTLDNPRLALAAPAGAAVTVENLSWDAPRSRFAAELVAVVDGTPTQRQKVGGKAVAMLELPVLNRRVMPGEVIAEGDVDWISLPRDRAGAGVLTEPTALVGQTVRRGVAPFQPVRAGDVRAPVVVARGALVTIMLQSATMTLTAQGKAMAEGGMDETIRVVNTASSRVVEARIAGPDLVIVAPPAQARQVAANSSAAR